MLTPILNWVENVKKHNAQSVVVWWGVLIFTALIPVTIKNWMGVFPAVATTKIATCQIHSSGCNSHDIMVADIVSKNFYNW